MPGYTVRRRGCRNIANQSAWSNDLLKHFQHKTFVFSKTCLESIVHLLKEAIQSWGFRHCRSPSTNWHWATPTAGWEPAEIQNIKQNKQNVRNKMKQVTLWHFKVVTVLMLCKSGKCPTLPGHNRDPNEREGSIDQSLRSANCSFDPILLKSLRLFKFFSYLLSFFRHSTNIFSLVLPTCLPWQTELDSLFKPGLQDGLRKLDQPDIPSQRNYSSKKMDGSTSRLPDIPSGFLKDF